MHAPVEFLHRNLDVVRQVRAVAQHQIVARRVEAQV
jgi:hypothetical protein